MAKGRVTVDPNSAVGYVRVSTDEQRDSGLGLSVQRAAIEAECQRKGWNLVKLYEDAGVSGKSTKGRPQLAAALEAVKTGVARTLIVYKIDRLSRSTVDFAHILRQARAEGWNLASLDLGLDLSTPTGEMIASVVSVLGQFEARLISERTKSALAVKKSRGERVGRRRSVPDDVVARMVAMRNSGMGFRAIATVLNNEGVPTASGGTRWWDFVVSKTLRSVERDAELAANRTSANEGG